MDLFNKVLQENAEDDSIIEKFFQKILTQVESVDPFVIQYLQKIPVKCREDLYDCIAQIVRKDQGFVLEVNDDIFLLKRDIAISVILHEIAHAIIMINLLTKNDVDGYYAYCNSEDEGHNAEWEALTKELASHFGNIPVAKTIDMDDDNIYENTEELTESRLREASKRRFIEPVWKIIKDMENEEALIHSVSNEKHASDFPSADEIIKWVDSGAADKYKIDWNTFTDRKHNAWLGEVKRMLKCYFDYLTQKEAKKDPKAQFADESCFKILKETDNWLFVGVLSYDGAVYCDSFQCGGAGARWCIGYEQSDSYWHNYTWKNCEVFVLAYNKKKFGDENDQKYMLELEVDDRNNILVSAWFQDDDPNRTLRYGKAEEKFELDDETLVRWYQELFAIVHQTKFKTAFSLLQSMKNTAISVASDDSYMKLLPDTEYAQFSYYQMLDNVQFKDDIDELVYDGRSMPKGERKVHYKQFRMLPTNGDQSNHRYPVRPNISFNDMEEVHFDGIWASSDWPCLSFRYCKKVIIDNLYIPEPYDLELYENCLKNNEYQRILKNDEIAIDFIHCPEVIINGIAILPNGGYSVMSSSILYGGQYIKFLCEDDFTDGTCKLVYDSYRAVRINMLPMGGTWEDAWAPYIDTEKKLIFVNKLIYTNPNKAFNYVKLYNVPLGYRPAWASEDEAPNEMFAIPYNLYKRKIQESTLFNNIFKEIECGN